MNLVWCQFGQLLFLDGPQSFKVMNQVHFILTIYLITQTLCEYVTSMRGLYFLSLHWSIGWFKLKDCYRVQTILTLSVRYFIFNTILKQQSYWPALIISLKTELQLKLKIVIVAAKLYLIVRVSSYRKGQMVSLRSLTLSLGYKFPF